VDVLKGAASGKGSKSRFRTVLVVFQFTVSILLLIMTGVILAQIRFMRNKDLGFSRERVVVIRLDSPDSRSSVEALKREFRRLPAVVSAGSSSHAPDWGARHNVCQPEGFALNDMPGVAIVTIDQDYLEAMRIEIVQGRGFSNDFLGDASKSVLINETAARRFGWDNPVGKGIREMDSQAILKTVVGVVRDFHYMDVRRLIEPMMLVLSPQEVGALVVRLSPGRGVGGVEELRRVYRKVLQGSRFRD
jgi:putative ABC transport system permease protein